MRDIYPEWYWPTDDELSTIVRTGLIVLDANVLLDLYRHSQQTCNELLATLENAKIRPRLRLTHQAGLEFHKNRLGVAGSHEKQYRDVERELDQLKSDPAGELSKLFTAIAKIGDQDVQRNLEKTVQMAVKRAVKKTRKVLKTAREDNVRPPTQLRVNDPLRDRIEKLFADPEQLPNRAVEDYEKIKKEAGERLEKNLPPGTADRDKDDQGIGDAQVWLEMKMLAKESGLPVLFVSGDRKDDWVERSHGKDLGPKVVLRQEFLADTGQVFHNTTWRGFLAAVSQHLDITVDVDTITAVADDEARAIATARAQRDRVIRAARARARTRDLDRVSFLEEMDDDYHGRFAMAAPDGAAEEPSVEQVLDSSVSALVRSINDDERVTQLILSSEPRMRRRIVNALVEAGRLTPELQSAAHAERRYERDRGRLQKEHLERRGSDRYEVSGQDIRAAAHRLGVPIDIRDDRDAPVTRPETE